MNFEFKPSFERSIKSFPAQEKEEIKQTAIRLIDVLSRHWDVHKGMGLKRMRGHYWEARQGIKSRILFRWQGDLVEFVLAGNHDDIKRFLRNI